MNERVFIVSDLHGQGRIYFSMINYLEKLKTSKNKIILYINGDLIDRGPDSVEMLIDVMDRIVNKTGKIEVHMLAGNHELLMYEAYKRRKYGKWDFMCSWLFPPNGGNETREEFDKLPLKQRKEIINFIGGLDLYKVFDGSIVGKDKIILTHADVFKEMNKKRCNIKLRDAYKDDKYAKMLWARGKNKFLKETNNLGIVGHTPNNSKTGYKINKDTNILNIDGGCAHMFGKLFHNSPLVELNYKRNYIKISGFNKEGIITYNRFLVVNKKFINYDSSFISKVKKLFNKNKCSNKNIKILFNSNNHILYNTYSLVPSKCYSIKKGKSKSSYI